MVTVLGITDKTHPSYSPSLRIIGLIVRPLVVLAIVCLDIVEIETRYCRRGVYTISTKELSRRIDKRGKVI